MMNSFIEPNWPAPKNIKAYTTLRKEGFSLLPKVDNAERIAENRSALKKMLNLPNDPIWIKQIHSNLVCEARKENINQEADASYTEQPNQVCIVLTADCLPILLCDQAGKHVAAIHGGWRGLAAGVIEATIKAMNVPANHLLAWIGPCISAKYYEVGDEVRDTFLKNFPAAKIAFTPSVNTGKWMADLLNIAKLRLNHQGVTAIYGGEYCTYSSPELFHSYRREKELKGHLATLIWIAQ